VHGSKYAIFYQPTILPHIISAFLPEDELERLKRRLGVKKLHLIPDIAIAKDVEEFIDWGESYKVRDKVRLIVEAKLSLKEIAEYETLEVAESQLDAYKKLLKTNILVVILEPNSYAKSKLEKDVGAKVIDDALNNTERIAEIIKEIV